MRAVILRICSVNYSVSRCIRFSRSAYVVHPVALSFVVWQLWGVFVRARLFVVRLRFTMALKLQGL
ncbi:hypothetical protein HMPREF0737_01108 [Rothia mucilaginosa M508]|uniref:Uncharacterized protein n=1 Tax=Rothia mucilaginosa M508 TaxID=563033 RepID=G5ES48_9MICC|nr:hypothetical protein HMPREF0737_01108 [Rothia mucilaginosa M508]